MQEHQFINFDAKCELDQPVYRIMKQEHVFSLFRDRRNAMSRFSNWKDNFENFLMRCGHEVDGVRYDNTTREKMVAQCWTKEKYAEAMWGIYANDQDQRFLRIRSTPRLLLSALCQAKPDNASDLCRVGRVKYELTSEIRAYYDKNKNADVSMQLLFHSLLRKRRAFSHEREVRLMYCALFGALDERGLFWYDVDPQTMITQIMADPNRDRSRWRKDKTEIQRETGFLGEIKRSKIYDAPDW
ncbi:hypothetical protein [Pelagimonas varians]|uniref:DUF2971 domain-containing protein n=1 Tax=Pelagimonas varians TaxID=696760 RepID=A0A238L4V6_9RHOB|nr:hypothetical protein [Pelagimonas varians]PYG26291.1 hypothetical protein C8N36_12634 [Pelagimonas varians]SMX50104.1 hypothetical protein PEV8663_04487 [Pelagimonas varians]